MRFARLCRLVAAGLIGGIFRSRTISEIEAAIARGSVTQQVLIVGATLGLLFAGAFVAAQFGLIGMALYLMAVVLLVR